LVERQPSKLNGTRFPARSDRESDSAAPT